MKLFIMIYVLNMDESDFIVTLGDAAASFLERPEPFTLGKCLSTDNTSLKPKRSPPAFSALKSLELHSQTDVWSLQPQKYNAALGIDKAVPAIIS